MHHATIKYSAKLRICCNKDSNEPLVNYVHMLITVASTAVIMHFNTAKLKLHKTYWERMRNIVCEDWLAWMN